MAANLKDDQFQIQSASAVRGFHVYRDIWEPIIGEELTTEYQTDNIMDKHSVAVLKKGKVVGHLPREKSKVYWFFFKHKGTITVKITEGRRYSKQAGGLEVPCTLTFTSTTKQLVDRLKTLL